MVVDLVSAQVIEHTDIAIDPPTLKSIFERRLASLISIHLATGVPRHGAGKGPPVIHNLWNVVNLLRLLGRSENEVVVLAPVEGWVQASDFLQ